jgi:putative copper resistance protein D
MLVAIRAVHFGAVLLLFGGFAFLAIVAWPTLRELGTAAQRSAVHRWVLGAAAISVAVALVTAALWLALAAAQMSGLPWQEAWRRNAVSAVINGTWFGRVWTVRFAVAVALGVLIAWSWREAGNRLCALAASGLLAALLLAALALAGHAAASSATAISLVVAADALHLLAAGAWLGSLPAFLLLLSRLEQRADRFALAGAAARRLSALGIVSVACLVATGLVSSVYLLGGVPALLGTPYGRLLSAKLGLFALMLGFAAANRRRWIPMLQAADAGANSIDAQVALQALKRNAMRETWLGSAIVLIVGVLGTVSPGAHDEIVWPLPFTLSWPGDNVRSGPQLVLAIAGVVAGVVVAFALGARRVGRVRAGMVGIGIALIAAAYLCAVPAHPTTYSHSPVPYTATSIARGNVLYMQHCATCHGANGYGDGPGAAPLAVKPLPLTNRLFSRREGDLLWWLGNGVPGTAMPGFSTVIGEAESWDIINFLLAQADAEGAKTMDGSVEPWRGTVAPDFAFEMQRGQQETLKQQRERSHVLLILFTYPESMPRLCILAATEKLARGGIRLLAVPMNREAIAVGQPADARCLQPMIAAGLDSDIVTAYTLFRRIPPVLVPPVPSHSEFLIDRQGYLRARWIPEQGYVWDGQEDLLRQVATMERKESRADAPERPAAGITLH